MVLTWTRFNSLTVTTSVAISLALHFALGYLNNRNTYIRLLFVDSSVLTDDTAVVGSIMGNDKLEYRREIIIWLSGAMTTKLCSVSKTEEL